MLLEMKDLCTAGQTPTLPIAALSPDPEGLGFLPILIAAIPALAATGLNIAGGIMGGQAQKKIEKKQQQLAQIQQQQQMELAAKQAEMQALQRQNRMVWIKTGAIVGGLGLASLLAFSFINKRIK